MRPRQSERTVRFVAFACERDAALSHRRDGSQVYAKRCRSLGERVVGMLCLEMVGFYSSAPNSQRYLAIPNFLRRFFPPRGDFLAAVGNLRSWKLLWKFRRDSAERSVPAVRNWAAEAIHDIRDRTTAPFGIKATRP